MNYVDDSRSRIAGGKGWDVSGLVLVAANLVPLAGVLIWGWSIFNVVLLYWLENVIIGGINLLKIFFCAPDLEQLDLKGKLMRRIAGRRGELGHEGEEKLRQFEEMSDSHGGKLALLNHGAKFLGIPFFTLHYGFFCLVHGMFIVFLLGGGERLDGFMEGGSFLLGSFSELVKEAVAAGGAWAALALAASHLFSFAFNYLSKGEFRRTAVPMLMIAPYGRVVVLHLAILFGAFATEFLGSPVILLVLLIFGKIVLDWIFHKRAHRKPASGGAGVDASC